jgi:endonuclease YncB( thermonuclease family)
MSLNRLLSLLSALAIAGAGYVIWSGQLGQPKSEPSSGTVAQAENAGIIVGRVDWVTDGDTLRLKGYEAAIRLWGIDTPERGEQGFEAAKQALIAMTRGQTVRCRPVERDRYGRMVARCTTDAGDTGRMLLDGGFAVEYCRHSRGFYGRC